VQLPGRDRRKERRLEVDVPTMRPETSEIRIAVVAKIVTMSPQH